MNVTTDDGTYFWPESDGWRLLFGFCTFGPFATFERCMAEWAKMKAMAVQI